jgi:hypothetical protein
MQPGFCLNLRFNYSRRMNQASLIIITILLAMGSFNCTQPTDQIRPGSICTIEDGEGKFGIVKVLVINSEEAHLKIYKNKYAQRPAQVDISTLSLGSINDKEGGFGIGHIPLEREGFDNWKPVAVAFEELTEDDLAGYEIWKNQ